jgi:hypothetical protein
MHSGKETICVERPDFRYRSPANDWASVFPQFAAEIEKRTQPGLREAIECNFTNTTATDRVCSHIALMDVCQQYFDYSMRCGCGFPRIDLMGTVEDWRLLRAKAEGLRQFQPDDTRSTSVGHLAVWLSALLPTLDHFVAAAEGSPDLAFWGSVCNLAGASGHGGPSVTGWIGLLFPYIQGRPNGQLNFWSECFRMAETVGLARAMELADIQIGGIDLKHFPIGLSKAPVHVIWEDVEKEEDLVFYGGLFTRHQHPDGALEVRTGWGVVVPNQKGAQPRPTF